MRASKKIVSENYIRLRNQAFINKKYPKELIDKLGIGTCKRLEEGKTSFGVDLLDEVADFFKIETKELLINHNQKEITISKNKHNRYKINMLIEICEKINDDGLDFLIATSEGIALNYPINKSKQTA